jgi:hypothetical protein
MPGVSSKKDDAAAEMIAALHAAKVKGGRAQDDGTVEGGFADSDDAVCFSGDFEFFKAIAYKFMSDTNSRTLAIVAPGHLAKSLATTQLNYAQAQQARPLLSSIDIKYGTPKYDAMIKGTRIDNTREKPNVKPKIILIYRLENHVKPRFPGTFCFDNRLTWLSGGLPV